MTIRVVCTCGRRMQFPDDKAGTAIHCPACKVEITLPSARENQSGLIRWNCTCGQRLKARPRTAGRQVTCPHCGKSMQTPLPDINPPQSVVSDTPTDMINLDE